MAPCVTSPHPQTDLLGAGMLMELPMIGWVSGEAFQGEGSSMANLDLGQGAGCGQPPRDLRQARRRQQQTASSENDCVVSGGNPLSPFYYSPGWCFCLTY